MTTIFTVVEQGDHYDGGDWPVLAFTTREAAEAAIARARTYWEAWHAVKPRRHTTWFPYLSGNDLEVGEMELLE